MNKNVSLWRGDNTPPTNYHIWIKSDNSINICNNDNWETVTYPELSKDLKDYVNEQILILKDGADIDFDTLKEINDWIKEHEQDYVTIIPELTSKIETLETLLDNKVNKELGKDLSTNDYTTYEKDKLSGIEAGAKANVQSDWNITDSKSDLFIKNKPTIPSETTIQNWGFTKNTGTYNKPNTGIPKSDLEISIQNSLNKADTALQEVPSDYVTTQDLQDSITNKVDRTDNAPELTSGFAGNLVGRGESASEEIGFRPSGGLTSVNDGAARIERLKGNTVVWNQLCEGSFPITISIENTKSNNKYLYTGIRFNTRNINTHNVLSEIKYKVNAGHASHSRESFFFNYQGVDIKVGLPYFDVKELSEGTYTISEINNYTTDEYTDKSQQYWLCVAPGDKVDITFISAVVYDLTQMFGAGNEPTTIEEFNDRKPIGIDEYAYNEGELISTTADEIKSVGFNAWDEEWENGLLDSKGENLSSTTAIRSVNHIPVLPNTTYFFDSPSGTGNGVAFYDENKVIIPANAQVGKILLPLSPNSEFTTPANCRYIRFDISSGYGGVYNHDICIHLVHTGYRNGEYEPYEEFRRSLPISEIKDSEGNALFPNGLLSAGSVYDEITETKAIKRIGMVDMGALSFNKHSEDLGIFKAVINGMSSSTTIRTDGLIAERYTVDSTASIDASFSDKTYKRYSGLIYIRDSSYTDVAAFKAAMSGVMLYYELAEPIEVDLPEPLNLDYEVSDFGTEEVMSDTPTTPLKADIIYQFNAVDRIRENSANIKKIEDKLDDISVDLLTPITYSSLKALRDGGSLVKGMWYRITDYVTTTVQSETKSANHPFDVIVLATSKSELSHHAKAIAHEGDTYFDGNDLGAWELWYDLDNDTTKYEWADATNGKGVIYRMIDEKRNDCPYDFKNVLFYNDKLTTNTTEDKYYYTFSYVVSGVLYDGTVEKQVSMCYGNSMGIYMLNKKRVLNKNVWRNIGFQSICHGNALGNNCHDNIFGNSSHDNTFGNGCYNNTFMGSGYYNTFEGSCYNNTFGENCKGNTLGNSCYKNTLGNNCHGNIFGNSSHDNTFENNCTYRKVNRNKTFITLNDEYYDDGSGQLVPIKHPDLSTQPSILPYKFMGQYVYEQLIPIENPDTNNSTFRIDKDALRRVEFPINGCVILEADEILLAKRLIEGYPTVTVSYKTQVSFEMIDQYGEITELQCSRFKADTPVYNKLIGAYLRVVYTTLPEENGGDYYGYENY